MNGASAESPPSPVEGELMTLLRSLDREEILQVLSFSTDGLCRNCRTLLTACATSFRNEQAKGKYNDPSAASVSTFASDLSSIRKGAQSISLSDKSPWLESSPSSSGSVRSMGRVPYPSPASVPSVNSEGNGSAHSCAEVCLNDGLSRASSSANDMLSEDQKEQIRISQVGRKKDFTFVEKFNGKMTNILQGLELHTGVFNSEEQNTIVQCVYDLQRKGQKRQLSERTYTEPRKWMRGKGRVTIQFGCCYNYAVDKDGNPPGILKAEEVDPLPPMFIQMIKRMVRWRILPSTCVPDSCIVNIYDEGDCIPPHIDHHDFHRPFCTVSFLVECNILFGLNLKTIGPGEFSGSASISLPLGSVLILNGNGADVAKHCIPSVPAKRISITFRKMDESKLPYCFSPNPELLVLKPFTAQLNGSGGKHSHDESVDGSGGKHSQHESVAAGKNRSRAGSFLLESDDFPSLGSSVARSGGDVRSRRKQ